MQTKTNVSVRIIEMSKRIINVQGNKKIYQIMSFIKQRRMVNVISSMVNLVKYHCWLKTAA